MSRKPRKDDKTKARAPRAPGQAVPSAVTLPVVSGRTEADPHFACRECPARCCRLPWSIRFGEEEKARYLAEPFVAERVGEGGLAVIRTGMLPTHAPRQPPGKAAGQRLLQCMFLDDDELCSLQKRFGHAYLPKPCQAFPFGFVTDEEGSTVAQLSLLCPSIRDNRGEPVGPELLNKLEQRGGSVRMSHRLATLSGVFLTRPQFLSIAAYWDEALAGAEQLPSTLARLYDQTSVLDGALKGAERVPDADVQTALTGARAFEPRAFLSRPTTSYHARLLFTYLLSNLCYPSRVRQPNRVDQPAWFHLEGVRAFGNKVAWLFEVGKVDLMFVPRPFSLRRVGQVERFLSGDLGQVVRDYLRLVLARRQVFTEPRHLMAPLLDLALGAVLTSRFARCLAAADGRSRVHEADVREGIGVTELLLLHHASQAAQPAYLQSFRTALLTSPDKVRQVLASEA